MVGRIENYQDLRLRLAQGDAMVGNAGIEIKTIAFLQDQLGFPQEDLEPTSDDEHHLFAFVLQQRRLLEGVRNGQNIRVHLPVGKGISQGLVGITKVRPRSSHLPPLAFCHQTDGIPGFGLAKKIRNTDLQGLGQTEQGRDRGRLVGIFNLG